MIVECNYCESKVDAKFIAEHERDYGDPGIWKVSLVECPICKQPLLAIQELVPESPEKFTWTEPERAWPDPELSPDWSLPDQVRDSLEEAKRCFKANAYRACAVMCGRVLESMCFQYKTKRKTLAGGLKELLDRKVIDDRLYKWSTALRTLRNIGAHAASERISKEDATDLLDFANAICQYVFVLTKKFDEFKKRREEK